MADTSYTTRWLPSAWIDEFVPSPLPDPSDFIRGPVGDLWLIAQPDDDGVGEEDEFYRIRIEPGATVIFDELREWPDISVVIDDAGKIVSHDPIPEGATLFCIPGDPETASDTIRDAFTGYELRGETVDVHCYDWSHSAEFRLVVDGSGARFELVGEVNHG